MVATYSVSSVERTDTVEVQSVVYHKQTGLVSSANGFFSNMTLLVPNATILVTGKMLQGSVTIRNIRAQFIL